MRNERDVKKAVKKILREYIARDEIHLHMEVPSGYGTQGIPDFSGVARPGRSFFIETKFGKNTLSDWQAIQITNLRTVGAKVWVVNERNLDEFEQEFRVWFHMEALEK